jgi:hypothetical protein
VTCHTYLASPKRPNLHSYLSPSMAEELILFCYIINTNGGSQFPVKISRTETVGDLKEAILKETPITLKHFDADQISLWKVSISSGKGFVKRIRSSADKFHRNGDEPLRPTWKLSDYFNDDYWQKYRKFKTEVLVDVSIVVRESL